MANEEDISMSDRSSDSEDAGSDRSDSPEQNEAAGRPLPADNPSNIPSDVTISDSRTAKRPTKKPKMAERTPVAPKGK